MSIYTQRGLILEHPLNHTRMYEIQRKKKSRYGRRVLRGNVILYEDDKCDIGIWLGLITQAQLLGYSCMSKCDKWYLHCLVWVGDDWMSTQKKQKIYDSETWCLDSTPSIIPHIIKSEPVWEDHKSLWMVIFLLLVSSPTSEPVWEDLKSLWMVIFLPPVSSPAS